MFSDTKKAKLKSNFFICYLINGLKKSEKMLDVLVDKHQWKHKSDL